MQVEAGEPVAADVAFGEALLTALTVDHKVVAAQAISKRIFVRADRLGRSTEALAELPLARALNTHVADDIDLYSEFLNIVGVVQTKAASVPEARQTLQAALELRDGQGRENTLLTLHILNNLAVLARRDDDIAGQIALCRQLVARSRVALGEHHPWHVTYTATLAQALARAGRPGEARDLLAAAEQALAGTESGQVRGWVLLVLGDLARGSIDHEERDLVAARSSYQAILDERSAAAAIQHLAEVGLGFVAAQEGNEAEMRARFAAILAHGEQTVGVRDPAYLVDRNSLGAALLELGRTTEAIEQFESVLAACDTAGPAAQKYEHCDWGRYQLGRAYQQRGDYVAAEQALTRTLARWTTQMAPHDPNVLALRRTLAEVVLGQGRHDEAAQALRTIAASYEATVEPDYVPLARTRFALARALTADLPAIPPEAATLAGRAHAVLAARGPAHASEALTVATFLKSR